MIAALRRLLSTTRATGDPSRIAQLNDQFRARPYATPDGRVLFSPGVMALARKPDTPAGLAEAMFLQVHLLALVRDAFSQPMFDPPETRDAGTVSFAGRPVAFRIEYLSLDLSRPARDPADAANTVRVMILSLPEEQNPYRVSLMLPPDQLVRAQEA